MVEAAVRALGNPQLGVFYTSIEKRRGSKIARVALARRLLTPPTTLSATRAAAGPSRFPLRFPAVGSARLSTWPPERRPLLLIEPPGRTGSVEQRPPNR